MNKAYNHCDIWITFVWGRIWSQTGLILKERLFKTCFAHQEEEIEVIISNKGFYFEMLPGFFYTLSRVILYILNDLYIYNAIVCFWSGSQRSSCMQLWMSDCSFTQHDFGYSLKRCTKNAVWLLHGWCHAILLPSWCTFCVHHTIMHQFANLSKATYIGCMCV